MTWKLDLLTKPILSPVLTISRTIKSKLNLITKPNYIKLFPSSHDIKDNCKLAFEAAEKLGVARLIEPSDMVSNLTIIVIILVIVIVIVVIIIITRPRPAFGRLGLGGSSGGYSSHG